MNYPQWLLVGFAAYWLAWAIRPRQWRIWMAENAFSIVVVAGLIVSYPRYRLSDLSYTLIVIFLGLHTIGGHYTYSKVPYAHWFSRLVGRRVTRLFGARRNHYDRLVHFCFGLLLAYPAREAIIAHAKVEGGWSYVLATSFIMSSSMLFELAEWGAAALLGGDAGPEYLAAQGDEWDAQKDMALASLGAVLAMGLTALIS